MCLKFGSIQHLAPGNGSSSDLAGSNPQSCIRRHLMNTPCAEDSSCHSGNLDNLLSLRKASRSILVELYTIAGLVVPPRTLTGVFAGRLGPVPCLYSLDQVDGLLGWSVFGGGLAGSSYR